MKKLKSILLSGFLFVYSSYSVRSQTAEQLCEQPIKTRFNQLPANVVTNETISLDYLTFPSLWWAIEQFDPFYGRFAERWAAYPDQKRIDLVVNRQLWALLDYAQRYSYLNHVGNVAREYQYDLRIVSFPRQCLATYTCQKLTDLRENCSIHFDSLGLAGLVKKKK